MKIFGGFEILDEFWNLLEVILWRMKNDIVDAQISHFRIYLIMLFKFRKKIINDVIH